MKDESYTTLGIFSHTLTPDQLNSMLGMKCDRGYVVGDVRKPTIIREKENGWIIRSRLPRNAPLEKHVNDMLERVEPIKKIVRQLADQPDVEVQFRCVVETSSGNPGMFLSRRQVADICEMGASLDIDTYVLPEGEGN